MDTHNQHESVRRENANMKSIKIPLDESQLTYAQREALAIAKTQNVAPINSLRDIKLHINRIELEKFAKVLDERRQDIRNQFVKDRL